MRKIYLYNSNKVSTVSDEDYDYLCQFKWYLHIKGYAVRTIPLSGSQKSFMHREVLERKLGRKLEKKEVVDHINHKTLYNVRSNLRAVSHEFNLHNVGRKAKNNKSGYRGVSRHKLSGLWRARLTVNDKEHCSYHKTRSEASKAHKEMIKKYYPAL